MYVIESCADALSSTCSFGGTGQRQLSLGGAATSSTFDAKHDMVLALIDWVEKGIAPDMIIGAKYVDDDKRNGTAFERPHCVCVEFFLLSLSMTRPRR